MPWSVRYPTQANHTATHLLHECLREVLGDHVKQAGSAVRPDKLRFDFTHPQALTAEERTEVEQRVNERVFANLPVRIFETPIEEARKLGAMMLFGEKYGDIVRVVDIDGWSVELCGGTHVRSTAEIGPFAILSESSVGAGRAADRGRHRGRGVRASCTSRRERPTRCAASSSGRARSRSGRAGRAGRLHDRRQGGRTSSSSRRRRSRAGRLRDLSDRIRQQEKADGAIVASVDDGRAFLVVNFDESLVARGLDAVQLVRELGKHIGGGGGGKPTLAEAGGKNPDGVARRARSRQEGRRRRRSREGDGARLRLRAHRRRGLRPDRDASRGRSASSSGPRPRAGSPSSHGSSRGGAPEQVVVGHPLTLRGERGEQAHETEQLRDALRGASTSPSCSSTSASRPTSRSRRRRRARGRRAAAHLLSSYLAWSSAAPA